MNEQLPTDFRLAPVFHMAFKAPYHWASSLFFSLFSVLYQLTEHFKVHFCCYVLPHGHPLSIIRQSNPPIVCSSLLHLYHSPSGTLLIPELTSCIISSGLPLLIISCP